MKGKYGVAAVARMFAALSPAEQKVIAAVNGIGAAVQKKYPAKAAKKVKRAKRAKKADEAEAA